MLKKVIQEAVTGKIFISVYIACYVITGSVALKYQTEEAIRLGLIMTFFLGILITIYAIASSTKAYKSKSWCQAKMNLVNCYVRKDRSKTGKVYKPIVKYEFWVNDQRYTGKNIDFSQTNKSKKKACQIIKSLNKHAENLRVYYNPKNPKVNVIEPGLYSIQIRKFIFGPALSAIALLYLVIGIINSR